MDNLDRRLLRGPDQNHVAEAADTLTPNLERHGEMAPIPQSHCSRKYRMVRRISMTLRTSPVSLCGHMYIWEIVGFLHVNLSSGTWRGGGLQNSVPRQGQKVIIVLKNKKYLRDQIENTVLGAFGRV